MAAGRNGNNSYPPFPMTATTMVAGLNGGSAVTRIRSPNSQDVLCGRGGGINSHKGNVAFRKWVGERKAEYNLAQNKKEKIAVAMQVVSQVHQQVPVPGRFLQKDPTSNQWWVEVDEGKALAKTTQALREGAPKIRQAHQNADVGSSKPVEKGKKRKRKATEVAPAMETTVLDDDTEKLVLQTMKQHNLPRYKSEQLLLPTKDYSVALEQLQENVEKAKQERKQEVAVVQREGQSLQPQATSQMTHIIAPLTSNKVFHQMYSHSKNTETTKPRFNPLMMPAVDPFAETPPLMSAPEPDNADNIPTMSLGRTVYVDDAVPPLSMKKTKLTRVHSLSLPDVDDKETDLPEFVNPFEDESNVFSQNFPNITRSHAQSSVFNNLNGDHLNTDAIGIVSDVYNGPIDQSSATLTDNSVKIRSIGGYLNRLLSFSSSSLVLNDSENLRETRQHGDDGNSESINEDYFFRDAVLDNLFSHQNLTTTDSKNSTNSLTRHISFTSRNRGIENGRQ